MQKRWTKNRRGECWVSETLPTNKLNKTAKSICSWLFCVGQNSTPCELSPVRFSGKTDA